MQFFIRGKSSDRNSSGCGVFGFSRFSFSSKCIFTEEQSTTRALSIYRLTSDRHSVQVEREEQMFGLRVVPDQPLSTNCFKPDERYVRTEHPQLAPSDRLMSSHTLPLQPQQRWCPPHANKSSLRFRELGATANMLVQVL